MLFVSVCLIFSYLCLDLDLDLHFCALNLLILDFLGFCALLVNFRVGFLFFITLINFLLRNLWVIAWFLMPGAVFLTVGFIFKDCLVLIFCIFFGCLF